MVKKKRFSIVYLSQCAPAVGSMTSVKTIEKGFVRKCRQILAANVRKIFKKTRFSYVFSACQAILNVKFQVFTVRQTEDQKSNFNSN